MDNMELKEARKELKEAKKTLMRNGYQRQLVYRLSYMKEEDGTWMNKNAFFSDKEEADMMIVKMMEINKECKIYSYISLNIWSWEMFIESWHREGAEKSLFYYVNG